MVSGGLKPTVQFSICLGDMLDGRRDMLVVGDIELDKIDLGDYTEVFELLNGLLAGVKIAAAKDIGVRRVAQASNLENGEA